MENPFDALQRQLQDIKDLLQKKESSTVISQVEQPIDINAAKEFLNLENVQTVYRMVRENRIPYHKKGSRLYFYKSELNGWIKSELVNN